MNGCQEDSMEQRPELKLIERRAYLSYHQDGLIDICLGMVFLAFGLVTLSGQSLFRSLCWMPGLLIAPLKKWITVPRMGMVKFGASGKMKRVKIALLLSCAAVLLFILAAVRLRSPVMDDWTHRYFLIFIGLLLVVFPFFGAVGLGIRRFYGYAFLFAAGFTLVCLDREMLAWVFTGFGSVLLIAGVIVLIRFLRKYRLPE
jgi:hypothetical protein